MVTLDSALTNREFHLNGCTRTVGPRGGIQEKVVRVRANGQVKTWKTRPGVFRLPIKHGLYTYGAIESGNAEKFHPACECPLGQ